MHILSQDHLTDTQKELLIEFERLSVNTRYPGNFTLSMNTFLQDLIRLRKHQK